MAVCSRRTNESSFIAYIRKVPKTSSRWKHQRFRNSDLMAAQGEASVHIKKATPVAGESRGQVGVPTDFARWQTPSTRSMQGAHFFSGLSDHGAFPSRGASLISAALFQTAGAEEEKRETSAPGRRELKRRGDCQRGRGTVMVHPLPPGKNVNRGILELWFNFIT